MRKTHKGFTLAYNACLPFLRYLAPGNITVIFQIPDVFEEKI
jgi:hypothetical protein